jgi:hypothetical protein
MPLVASGVPETKDIHSPRLLVDLIKDEIVFVDEPMYLGLLGDSMAAPGQGFERIGLVEEFTAESLRNADICCLCQVLADTIQVTPRPRSQGDFKFHDFISSLISSMLMVPSSRKERSPSSDGGEQFQEFPQNSR